MSHNISLPSSPFASDISNASACSRATVLTCEYRHSGLWSASTILTNTTINTNVINAEADLRREIAETCRSTPTHPPTENEELLNYSQLSATITSTMNDHMAMNDGTEEADHFLQMIEMYPNNERIFPNLFSTESLDSTQEITQESIEQHEQEDANITFEDYNEMIDLGILVPPVSGGSSTPDESSLDALIAAAHIRSNGGFENNLFQTPPSYHYPPSPEKNNRVPIEEHSDDNDSFFRGLEFRNNDDEDSIGPILLSTSGVSKKRRILSLDEDDVSVQYLYSKFHQSSNDILEVMPIASEVRSVSNPTPFSVIPLVDESIERRGSLSTNEQGGNPLANTPYMKSNIVKAAKAYGKAMRSPIEKIVDEMCAYSEVMESYDKHEDMFPPDRVFERDHNPDLSFKVNIYPKDDFEIPSSSFSTLVVVFQ
jgi:hypothetical protein